jgi:uncharacterized membrane protein YfcA
MSMETLVLMAVGVPVGFLIGVVGIGGVLLAPAIAHLFGRDIHDAVALSLASFVMAGVVAAANTRQAGASLRPPDWYLLGALVPGALLGSLVTPFIPAAALSIAISICVVLAGISCLVGKTADPTTHKGLGAATLIGLGIGAGLLSVISGTGGPMVLVPMLLAAGMEVRRMLAISQVAQLPVAATATLVNGLAGSLDLAAAGLLGLSVVAGMLAGLAVSRRLDASSLRWSVAWCLVFAGAGLLAADVWHMARAG